MGLSNSGASSRELGSSSLRGLGVGPTFRESPLYGTQAITSIVWETLAF